MASIVSATPVIAEWRCSQKDIAIHYLGYAVPDQECRVIADIAFQSNKNAAKFKIRVPILLEAFTRVTNLIVFIDPEQILSMKRDAAGNGIPKLVETAMVTSRVCTSSHDISALRFSLARPPRVVVPKGTLLTPRKDSNAAVLSLLKSLARSTQITLYLPLDKDDVGKALDDLCTAAGPTNLHTLAGDNLKRLYGGKGGVILDCESDDTDERSPSPPSYDELGPTPPPPPPEEQRLRRASKDLTPVAPAKKAKLDDVTEKTRSTVVVSSITDLAQQVDALRREVRQSDERLDERLHQLRSKLLGEVEERMTELRTEFEDELHGRLEDVRTEMEGFTHELIDDRLLDIKCDAEDFIRERLDEAEHDLKMRMKRANIVLEFGSDDE
ncbi:hypothetical protein MPH_13421 [Macrophomina phaseolina MS6]|uniref:Uncharacterized protein n=1 Tax=Macrophomina phaseolina (strain MS6) TaxID=1126212 RepID=K2R9K5_MACPH|nr:hypothetical protein MPH_13421 [Macrophomina phaseolina MS6]